MKIFTRKKLIDKSLTVCSSFKSFWVLVVIMLMTTSNAFGEAYFKTIDGLRYQLDPESKTATLLPNSKKYMGNIVVPDMIEGNDGENFLVTSFEDRCFYECTDLASITIPSSVTSLGIFCFGYCSGLTSITIPSSVTSLGNACFAYSGLTSITIPSSITSLKTSCFNGCERLKSINIPSSVTSIGDCCFEFCLNLTSITIPSSVTSLGNYCFDECRGLTSIAIPSSVTSLGDFCFDDCINLSSIVIPSSVRSLGVNCFYKCVALTSVTIPSSVTTLGSGCFSLCEKLEEIVFKCTLPKLSTYNSSYSDLGILKTCLIKVPAEYLEDYKKAFGPDYKYIYAWNPDESGEDNPTTPCATPSISYEVGKLKFACETTGAQYHYTISDKDIATDALSEDGNVSLSAAYEISVYATADGHTASEKAKATLYWINANLETTNINQAKTRGIVASAHDGIVSISGLDDGEVVKFYTADGKFVCSSFAVGGVASCAVSGSFAIAKIGKDAIKIAVK